jgi:DNA-binding response OmpR family regulator
MSAQFHGEQILLVEDNPRLLRSMAFLLTIVGFEVAAVSSAEDALKSLDSYVPHLIISDIDMPGMNGYDLLRQVRGCEAWHKTPFIFISDKYGFEDFMFALDLGVDEYVPKPFDITDVLEAIERTLQPELVQTQRIAV